VGHNPFGVAADDQTHTVYVSNNASGDLPGSVSMINEVACNGAHTAGCAAPVPTVMVGRSPQDVLTDLRTNRIYVAAFGAAAVSVINGAACNAISTAGCKRAVREQPAGSHPAGLAIIGPTLYVALGFPPLNAGPLAIVRITR
jgi:DNA-binding beta-propeller fold protein YncE